MYFTYLYGIFDKKYEQIKGIIIEIVTVSLMI